MKSPPRQRSPRQFIGRKQELELLESRRRNLGQSAGAMVLIGGEPGIGKTRLLERFHAASRESRTRIIVTSECFERRTQPFAPVRALVTALSRSINTSDLSRNVRRAVDQVTTDSSLPAPNATNAQLLLPGDLFPLIIEFIQHCCARHAVIFTVEDLHWADESTLDFLMYAVPRLAKTRLLIVGTYRSEAIKANKPFMESLGQLLHQKNVTRLTLNPLASSEIRLLLENATADSPIDAQVLRSIEELSEGNPFFAEELLKSALSPSHRAREQPLPLSIRATVLQRLALLSDDERRVLSHSAVIGYRFNPSLLAETLRTDHQTISTALQKARDLDLIVDDPHKPSLCRFRHALTQRIVYDELLTFDSRHIHATVLAILEQRDDCEDNVFALAEHAWISGDAQKTMRYNERAGALASSLGTLPEAVSYYRRALEVAGDDSDRARIQEALSGVLRSHGRLDAALEILRAVYDARIRQNQFDDAARLIGAIISEVANSTGTRATSIGDDFLHEHGDVLGVDARNRLLTLLARVASSVDDFAAVDRYLSRIRNPVDLPPRVRLNYLICQMNLHAYRGNVAEWKTNAFDCANVARALDDRFLAVIGFLTIAQSGLYLEADREVESALEEGEHVARSNEYKSLIAFGAAVHAYHCYLKGQSRAHIARALEPPKVTVAYHVLAAVGAYVGLALNDRALAERCLDDAVLKAALEPPIGSDAAVELAAYAVWNAAKGRREKTEAYLRLALPAISCTVPRATPVLVAAARFLPPHELDPLLDSIHGIAPDNVPGLANASLLRAMLARRRHDNDTAHEQGIAAAAHFEQLNLPLFKALALEAAGEAIVSAVARTRSSPRVRTTAEPTVQRNGLLSEREREIASAVTRGLTNVAISEGLSVSTKTVEKHLSSIFKKLRVRSRAEIAAYMTRHSRNE